MTNATQYEKATPTSKSKQTAVYLGLLILVVYIWFFIFRFDVVRPYTPGPIRYLSTEERAMRTYRAVIMSSYSDYQSAIKHRPCDATCEAEAATDFAEITVAWYGSELPS